MNAHITEAQWHDLVQQLYPRECRRYGTEEVALFIDKQDAQDLDVTAKVDGMLKRFPLSAEEYAEEELQNKADDAFARLVCGPDPDLDAAIAKSIAEAPVPLVEKSGDEWVTAVILALAVLAVIVAVVVPLRRLWP